MFFRETFELQKPRMQQVMAAQIIGPGIVVKRRRHLDQPLQERLIGVWRLQPHLFPVFVGLVKMPGIKGVKSFLKQPIFGLRVHRILPAGVNGRAPGAA